MSDDITPDPEIEAKIAEWLKDEVEARQTQAIATTDSMKVIHRCACSCVYFYEIAVPRDEVYCPLQDCLRRPYEGASSTALMLTSSRPPEEILEAEYGERTGWKSDRVRPIVDPTLPGLNRSQRRALERQRARATRS